MLDQLLQFLITGITIGSTYALVALGFSIIYNASDVVNFAQGEFVMIGAMSTITFTALGMPLLLAVLCASLLTIAVGMALEKFAIEPARGATVVATIIITIGASILLRGAALLIWGKDFYALPAFSGEQPFHLGAATILPQNLWVMGVTLVLVVLVRYFFNRTTLGKALLACSCNRLAAHLAGINVKSMLLLAYGLSAFLGSIAGVLIAPITFSAVPQSDLNILPALSDLITTGAGSSLPSM